MKKSKKVLGKVKIHSATLKIDGLLFKSISNILKDSKIGRLEDWKILKKGIPLD